MTSKSALSKLNKGSGIEIQPSVVCISLRSQEKLLKIIHVLIQLHVLKVLSSGSDTEDDLITLQGCGVQTKWRFPTGLKHCPLRRCRIQFGVRSDAITHYRNRHACYSILCPLCVKPICAQAITFIKNHYKRVHPNEELPYGLSRKTEQRVSKFW